MSNFFTTLYKGLRSMGVGFKESRKIVANERAAQRSEQAFKEQFGASFDEMVARAIEPRFEQMTLGVLDRHLSRLLPGALPQVLWQLSQAQGALGKSGEEDPGVLYACMSRSTGAYWGKAAEREETAFHASMEYDEQKHRYTITYKGGTVTDFMHGSKTFESGEKTATSQNVYAYLFYKPPASPDSQGEWSMEFNRKFPDLEEGQIYVPLWRFDYAPNGKGEFTQETEGLVFCPAIRNVVDVST